MHKGLILEVMALGQDNLLSNVLNTQFPYFIPWMIFFSPLDIFILVACILTCV